jgi:hypothetical protein
LREELLKQEEKDWKNHRIPLPKKEKDSFFILYRTEKNTLAWRQILEGEYFLLQLIQEGISIEQACEKIEQNHANLYEQAINHLQQWIQTWIQLDWLTEKKNVNI